MPDHDLADALEALRLESLQGEKPHRDSAERRLEQMLRRNVKQIITALRARSL